MSTSTQSYRTCPLHLALSGELADASNGSWNVQFFIDEREDDQEVASDAPWACLWLTARDQHASWLALPLGMYPATNSPPNPLPSPFSRADWEGMRPDLGALPDSSPIRRTCEGELDQLEQELRTSEVVHDAEGLWWIVPCSTWRPACALLAEHGAPSREILKDWAYQRSQRPGPTSMTLVSPNGLLVSCQSQVASLCDRFGAQPIPSIEDWLRCLESKCKTATCNRIRWPMIQCEQSSEDRDSEDLGIAASTDPPSTAIDSTPDPVLQAVFAMRAETQRPKSEIRKKTSKGLASSAWTPRTIAGVGVVVSAVVLLAALVLALNNGQGPERSQPTSEGISKNSASQSEPDSLDGNPSLAMDANIPASEPMDSGELATTPLDDRDLPQPDFNQLLDSLELSVVDRSALATASPSIANPEEPEGYEPANSEGPQGRLDLDRILKQSLSAGRGSMEPMDAPEPIANDEAMAEGDNEKDPLEIPGHTPQIEIGFANGPTRTEFKFGRGVIVRNSNCNATLSLGQDDTEPRDEWIVEPLEIQSAQGNAVCEWRVAKEDTDPELLVQLVSRPGNRWLLITRVGVRMSLSQPPVFVAGNDVSTVLRRLMTYQRWLSESIELSRNIPRSPRLRGPDLGAQVRWMQAQQRDTEKAIKQWTEVAELCDTLYANGKLKIELSVTPPKP